MTDEKIASGVITKTDDDKRLVFGWASIIKDVDGRVLLDRQNDFIDSEEELEKSAYEYVLSSRDGGEMHIRRGVATMVESVVLTEEKQVALGIAKGQVPVGWWIGFRVNDDRVWDTVKKGDYIGFSVHGTGRRSQSVLSPGSYTEVGKSDVTKVDRNMGLSVALGKLLADTISVYHDAHGFHWNVKGQDFSQYHTLFANIYEDLYGSVDPMAEDILKLGANAPFSMSEMMALRTVPDTAATSDPQSMASELLAQINRLLSSLDAVFAIANASNQQGIANFIAERIDACQKWAWQLRSSTGVQKSGTVRVPRSALALLTKAQHHRKNKVATVMREYKEGKLKSASGKKVKSRKQAIAIALAEQRRVG